MTPMGVGGRAVGDLFKTWWGAASRGLATTSASGVAPDIRIPTPAGAASVEVAGAWGQHVPSLAGVGAPCGIVLAVIVLSMDVLLFS